MSKTESAPEGSSTSTPSTPEHEHHPGDRQLRDISQTQKRKGGRKPIYATSEERKQRNRQAQAAFRERRTEYIKQLESTIKRHEEMLQNLKITNRHAADDCLMLQYKNSLLERILLEKGIDVQTELRARSETSSSCASHAASPVPGPSTFNTHHLGRGPAADISIKSEPPHGVANVDVQTMITDPSPRSPLNQMSHGSSPTTVAATPPNATCRPVIGSPAPVSAGKRPPQPGRPPHRARHSFSTMSHHVERPLIRTDHSDSNGMALLSPPLMGPRSAGPVSNGGISSMYPGYFETQANAMVDRTYQQPQDNPFGQRRMHQQSSGAENNVQTFDTRMPHSNLVHPAHEGHLGLQHSASSMNGSQPLTNISQLYDPFDPILEADPFGLSSNMQMCNQFSYGNR